MALNTPTVSPVNIPPVDHLDIIEGNAAVSAPGTIRMGRQNGILVISIDGKPYIPLANPTPSLESPGVINVAGYSIPGLVAWGRADNLTTAAGASWPAVTAIADQTGLATTAQPLVAVGAPTLVANAINGRPGINCVPATPTYMTNVTASLPMGDRGARTTFFVGQANSVAGGYQISFRQAAGAFLDAHRNSASTIFAHLGGSGDNQTLTDLPTIANVPHVWEHVHDGRQAIAGADSAARVLIDGVDKGITAGGFAVAETGTAGWSVGGFAGDAGNGWAGTFCEYMVFNRSLSAFERDLIRAYISAWYGIPCTFRVEHMNWGDSTAYGTGNAATIAAGGFRSALYALHPNLQSVGSFYTPKGGDATFNRCEGNVGFNSGTDPATGLGGSLQAALLTAHRPRLMTLQIGENDAALSLFSAAATGLNVRALCDTFYAASPDTKIIVARAIKMTSANAAVNAVIVAQAAQIEAALVGSPNVLACGPGGTRCLIPPDALLPDSLYADTLHLLPAGAAIVVANMWHPALLAAGY